MFFTTVDLRPFVTVYRDANRDTHQRCSLAFQQLCLESISETISHPEQADQIRQRSNSEMMDRLTKCQAMSRDVGTAMREAASNLNAPNC